MTTNWIWNQPDWPHFTWDMAVLAEPLAVARRAQGRLDMAGTLLGADLSLEALAEVMKVEGISTSAIEGERLNPESVAASVARHLGMSFEAAQPLDPKAEGLVSVMQDSVQGWKTDLAVERLCGWQNALFPGGWSGFHRVTVGGLRTGEVVVASGALGREVIHYQGVPSERLEAEMAAFVAWFNGSRGKVDGMVRAGVAHLWFVLVHPFDDGNGRVARALTDLASAQDGGGAGGLFRMSSRILAVRHEYYGALREVRSMDMTPWLVWFLSQVSEACGESERIIQRTLAKARFWATRQGSDLNERQRKALNRMLDAGPGGFEGGMNARKYCAMTRCSKPTASRDLGELLTQGYLVPAGGGGRSTAYGIPWKELMSLTPS